jgi:uncharacterized membrane protein
MSTAFIGAIKYPFQKRKPDISYIMYLFMLGSITGWCLEIVFRSVSHRELYIPGFLMGPYCPIYGFGTLIITYLCNHKIKVVAYIKVFLLSSVLEYVVSFIFENLFGRILWDYSSLPLSIGTRVSLVFSLAWGALGIAFLIFAEPILYKLWNRHKEKLYSLCKIGLAIMIADMIISVVSNI